MDPKAYIDTLREEYIATQVNEQERDALIGDNNIEKRDIKGYHGREILELLQNADDAYQKSIEIGNKPEKDLEVTIQYRGNILTVSNTGTFFDEDGIKGIVQGNNSPKKGKYIGNKGTGFRSVLNWANAVRIFSGAYAVEFSKEIAREQFEAIKNTRQIQKQLVKNKNLYIPMLAVPQNVEPKQDNDRTIIEIEIDPQKMDEHSVSKQIENIDLKILLFLPNICNIDIYTEENHIVYSRSPEGDSRFVLKKTVDGEDEITETYQVFAKRLPEAVVEDVSDGEKKDILMTIAVPENMETCEINHLYSFFPLNDTEAPFPCVMHASYVLGDHRDTIPNVDVNGTIIKEQLNFLIQGVVPALIKQGDYEKAQNLVIPNGFTGWRIGFLQPFGKFDQGLHLVDHFLSLVMKCQLFETVNHRMIAVADGPKMLNHDFPKWFNGKEFEKLLKRITNERISSFLRAVANKGNIEIAMSEAELCACINNLSTKWSAARRAEVFDWWNENKYHSSLPNLLKDGNGNWVKYKEAYYFLIGNFSEVQIPKWVKTPTIAPKDQEEIFKIARKKEKIIMRKAGGDKRNISRLICDSELYPCVQFKYRDRNSIVSAVNSSVKTYHQSVEYVKWLWKNYGMEEKWSLEEKITYKFPTMDKKVVPAEKTFIGKEYGFALANKLFPQDYQEVPAVSVFGLKEEEKSSFIDFLNQFGVHRFPEIKTVRIEPQKKYYAQIERKIIEQGDVGASRQMAWMKFDIPYINGLDQLLQELSTREIIAWVYQDHQLQDMLKNKYYYSGASITYLGATQGNPRKFTRGIDNYILMLFNTTPWITVNKEKVAPRDVVKGYNQWNQNKRFDELVNVLKTEELEQIATEIGISKADVSDVLDIFDIKSRVTDLRSPLFYQMMLDIPKMGIGKADPLSRAVYGILGQSEFDTKYEDCEEKTRYFKEGEVLVRHNNQLSFVKTSQAYLPSTTIVNKKEMYIVEKGLKSKNESFERVLGCRRYEREYRILKDSIEFSSANGELQEYFKSFKRFARPYADYNEGLKKEFGRLNLSLVSRIAIVQDNKDTYVDEEYSLLQDKGGNWYLTEHQGVFDCRKVSEYIEIIIDGYANSKTFDADKVGELFRTESIEDREFLIIKNFGSLSCLDESILHNEIRESFIKSVEKISGKQPNVDGVDFDCFEQQENISIIVDLLREMCIDIDQLEDAGFEYTINLFPYYKKQCGEFILNERNNYKNWLYTNALGKDSLEKEFLRKYFEFEKYELPSFEKSIHFDFRERVFSVFGNWMVSTGDILSADKAYSENYEKMNPQKEHEDEIANDFDIQRMIYFGKEEEFSKWMKKSSAQPSMSMNPEKEYAALRGIVPQKKEISFSEEEPERFRGTDGAGNRLSSSTVITSELEKSNRSKKVYGNKGELLIYNLLLDMYDNVSPRSEAFVELGILKPGQGKSGEYDLSYENEDGNEVFVEVKASETNQFFITPKEFTFAKEHADRYELYLVTEMNSNSPKYEKLPNRFWENSKFRQQEIIKAILVDF